MKRMIKVALKSLIIVLIFAVIATVLMTSVYMLPTDEMVENAKSVEEAYAFGNWDGEFVFSQPDHYSDIIMINTAIMAPYESALKNAMLNPAYQSDEPLNGPYFQLNDYLINHTDSDNEELTYSNYGRYWHGYLLYLKPLLLLFDLSEIRWLFYCLEFVLVVATEIILSKKSYLSATLFGVVLLFICPITTTMSFQNANVFIVMLICNIIIMMWPKKIIQKDRYIYFFLIAGIVTVFVDLSSCPVIALGIPLTTLLLYNEEITLKRNLAITIKSSIAFAIGFVGFWVCKWVLASVFTDVNMIGDAINALQYRTSGNDYSLFTGVETNLLAIYNKPMIILFAIFIIVIVSAVIRNKRNIKWSQTVLPLMIIMSYPFIWYVVVCNHAAIHPWLEYRHLAITIWAFSVIVIKLIHSDLSMRDIKRTSEYFQ